MQAMASEALPLTATPKVVIQRCATKLTLIYARAPRLKNSVIAYLIVFSEYGMTNPNISSVALPLTATPKVVLQRCATKLTLIYARAPRLKNSVIAYLIVFSEYGMTNPNISSVALPLTATQKRVKRG